MVHPTRSSSNLPVALDWKSRDMATFVPMASVLHWKGWPFQLKIVLALLRPFDPATPPPSTTVYAVPMVQTPPPPIAVSAVPLA